MDGYEACLADEGDSGAFEGFLGLDELRMFFGENMGHEYMIMEYIMSLL